jgi:hypothetical protein
MRRSTVLCLLACALSFAQAPGLSGRRIEYGRDVHPVLQSRCGSCHSSALRQGGLSVASVRDLKTGGASGPAVIPGTGGASLLLERITGAKAPRMPLGGAPLTEREIAVIRDWIDAGASEDTAGAAGSGWTAPLKPRFVEPPGKGHPVDAFLDGYWTKHSVPRPRLVSDEMFLRRVHFDLHGLPPSPDRRGAFLAKPDRGALIDELLADGESYAEHWISFWNDLLHNDEGVVYHGERKSITPWLRKALRDNMPYDQFVSRLIAPRGPSDPEGFVMGVNWRGDINASQTPAMQAAQNSAQVFLGVNIKCASCHDSFINKWKLKDAYGLASFFSKEPLEIVRCDAKTGEMSSVRFLFPDLGEPPEAAGLEAAASFFTHPENGRLSRTFVNRIWTRLIGRGLVENGDDMDAEPWSADLLDWLAWDFAQGGFDVRRLLRTIMTSAAYQASTTGPSDGPYVFRGPEPRRLTSEQFTDAVSAITGQWRSTRPAKAQPAELVRDWRLKASPLARALGRPVRDLAVTARASDPATLQALELMNGATLAEMLERGGRYLAGELRPAPEPLYDSGVTNAGPLEVDVQLDGAREIRLIVANHDTYDPSRVIAGWGNAVLTGPKGKVALAELLKTSALLKPRKGGSMKAVVAKLDETLIVPTEGFSRLRAKVAIDRNSTSSDINPRVRFLVYRDEPDRWRPLRITGSAPAALPELGLPRDRLIDYLYEYALSRQPTDAERKVASAMAVNAGGIADLLWALVLSPEFQFLM